MPGYTNVSKPTGATYTNLAKPGGATIRAGMKNMLMMPLTIGRPIITGNNLWTRVNKPTGSGYTNIAKPVD